MGNGMIWVYEIYRKFKELSVFLSPDVLHLNYVFLEFLQCTSESLMDLFDLTLVRVNNLEISKQSTYERIDSVDSKIGCLVEALTYFCLEAKNLSIICNPFT